MGSTCGAVARSGSGGERQGWEEPRTGRTAGSTVRYGQEGRGSGKASFVTALIEPGLVCSLEIKSGEKKKLKAFLNAEVNCLFQKVGILQKQSLLRVTHLCRI